MRKSISTLLLFFIGISSMLSQNTASPELGAIDERLLVTYEQAMLERMQVHNPMMYHRLVYLLDASWEIVEIAPSKVAADIQEITIDDLLKVNILALEAQYGMKMAADSYSMYKIKGSPLFLTRLSRKQFYKLFNEQYSRTR